MKPGIIFSFVISILLHIGAAYPYDVSTHGDLSVAAAESSVLGIDSTVLTSLGLAPLAEGQTFSINSFDRKTIIQHIRDGSRFEDNGIRVANHFFDPLHDRGLFDSHHRSPDWALEDRQDIDDQISSLKDARRNFYLALTASSGDERERRFGLTFEKLGQVIHHIQDMAQPQHTRNDDHLDFPFVRIPGLENPSRYELYTTLIQGEQTFEDLLAPGAYPRVIFSRARDFWHTKDKAPQEGQGVAEFTNANFVSAGNNFTATVQNGSILLKPHPEYPNPAWDQQTLEEVPLRTLLQDANCPGPAPSADVAELPGIITFFGTKVKDRYGNTEAVNPRASTLSIFDQDLELHGKRVSYPTADGGTYETAQVFSLNRFNFCATYPFLIPKAVAYSAGLIDYFFRGRLEVEDVELTDTGIRLRVKNAIDPEEVPAWKDETLYARTSAGAAGTFVVAYEYRDASGATRYGASPPVAATAGGDLAPGQTSSNSYDFSVSIPAEAREVKYRLVFRGRLGEEEDAVAVGVVEPFSGFLVNLSYIPADAIPGPRMIFRAGGAWRLSDKSGVRAGNVDWKGWYVNGRPTKVLSWTGERRYFSAEFFRFGRDIYQNGMLWSVAPRAVLGAAITKDADGIEWLIAITSDGTSDFVYRRRNTANTSPALFDPVTAPEGWHLLGSFTPFPNGLPPDRSWFFNGTGMEAQTMRRPDRNRSQELTRLKITVHGSSVQLDDLGNSPGLSAKRTVSGERVIVCRLGVPEQTFVVTTRTVMEGEYTVAVDYRDLTEVLVKVKGSGEEVINDIRTVCIPFVGTRHSFTTSISMATTLEFNDVRVTLNSREGTKSGNVIGSHESFQREGSSSARFAGDSFAIGFLDVRNDLVSGERRIFLAENEVTFDATQACTVGRDELVRRDVTRYRTEIVADERTELALTDRCTDRAFGRNIAPAPLSFGVRPFNPSPPTITLFDRVGSWAVDSNGNLAMSVTTIRNRRFNFLTDGDIRDLIPSAPDDASYSFNVIK